MKHLRVTEPGLSTYSGFLHCVEFKDGVSVEPLPRMLADRISASMQCVEINEDGTETQAGPAARLVTTDRALEAEVIEHPGVMTEDEKLAEQKRVRDLAKKKVVMTILTGKELEAIADKGGIKALREIAKLWGVKHREIPELIKLILEQQVQYQEAQKARAETAAGNEVVHDAATVEKEDKGEPSLVVVKPKEISAPPLEKSDLKTQEELDALKGKDAVPAMLDGKPIEPEKPADPTPETPAPAEDPVAEQPKSE